MKNLGRIAIVEAASLRAVFAIVFLLMSALQPGLFAHANATGFHADAGMTVGVEEPAPHPVAHQHAREDKASNAEVVSDDFGTMAQPPSGKSADKSCEVHCAPAHAVLVICPEVERVAVSCFAPAVATVLPLGEYDALIRPPRHLN